MSSSVPPGYAPPPPGIPPPQPAGSGGRGCWRVGLIGCGVAGLVVLLAIVVCFLYIRRNPQVVTDLVMSQVDSHFAPDVTDQEKKDLHEAYAAYRDNLRSGKATPEPLERVRGVFISTGSTNEISRAQVRELTAAFRRGAGLPPLTPASTPDESPGPGGAITPSRGSGAVPNPVSTPSP